MSHFQGVPEETLREIERNADGTFDYSLCNVFRVRKPVVIVDEAHNARTPLSFDTLDISEAGKLEWRHMAELEKQMTLLSVGSAWPIARLVNWLDRSFSHRDLTPTETGVFITSLVTHLADARKMTFEQLTANRYKLSRAVERKFQMHRAAAQAKIYKEFLSPEFATPLVVSKETQFQFPPDAYPAGSLYKGGYRFKKHYFPVIGDLKPDGEEFDCAVYLDGLPEVKFWVRNLPGPGRETTSFWLQTSTDKFYPDFVCLLADGRSHEHNRGLGCGHQHRHGCGFRRWRRDGRGRE